MRKLIHVLDKDKRKRKRVELFSNIAAQIEVLGISSQAKIKDVSYSGFGVVLPSSSSIKMIESLEAKLQLADQLFQGIVVNKIILPDQQIKIGISLPGQVHRDVDFNMQDSSWDRVTDHETVSNIFHDLAFKGFQAPIEIKQNFSKAKLHPMEITSSETMICDINQIHQGSLEKGKAKCMFDLFQTCHAFDTNIERLDSHKIELKLSNTLARLLRRQTIRVIKNKSNFEVKARLYNRTLEKEISEFEVHDFSEQGFSLKDPNGELSLPRNMNFEKIVLSINDGSIIEGSGQVRSYEWNQQQNAYVIGLLFEVTREPDLSNWHNFILASRYPHLNFDYQGKDHEKIWSLFGTSGYLDHLDKNQSDNLKVKKIESIDTWDRLQESGVSNSRRIMVKNKDDVTAHLQLDQYYKDSWCVHHLAISKDSSKIIAKDIYSAMTDFLSSRNTKYIITYHRPDLAWNQRNYHDFVKNYQYKNHNYMELFNLYDFKIDQFQNGKIFKEIETRKANEFDLASIYKYFTNIYQPFVLEALNIEQDAMRLEALESDFKQVNLVRGREFIVMVNDKKIKAFLQIEWGTAATNIFNLFDSVFVYLVEPLTEQEIHSLIKIGGDFLKSKGKSAALLLMREDFKVKLGAEGLVYLCDENRWVAKSATLKRYQSYAQILYGHLLTQREKIRDKIKKKNENSK